MVRAQKKTEREGTFSQGSQSGKVSLVKWPLSRSLKERKQRSKDIKGRAFQAEGVSTTAKLLRWEWA